MAVDLEGSSFVSVKDFTAEELRQVIDTALQLKLERYRGQAHPLLAGKTLAMIFQKPSLRTRVSFEAGMTQLGGHAHFIDSETAQIAHGESPKDMGIILSGYGHAIMIRHDLVPGEGQLACLDPGHHHDDQRIGCVEHHDIV